MRVVLEIPIDDLTHVLGLMRSYFSVRVKKVKKSVVDEKKYIVTFIVKDFNIPAEFEELIHILTMNNLLQNIVLIDEGDMTWEK